MSSPAVLAGAVPLVIRTKTEPLVTERQRQLLFLASQGMYYKEIAHVMGITPASCKQFGVESLKRLRRCGYEVRNLTGAVALALRQGWIE